MRNTYKLIAVVTVLFMLVLSGCNGQKASIDSDDAPTLVVEGKAESNSDEKGSFVVGDFTAEQSNAVKLGGSRTDKIEEMENAQIQRETVPSEPIEWIPGLW